LPATKESSDELEPRAVTTSAQIIFAQRRTVKDYLALALATWGVGYSPVAPGTCGSVVGVGIYLLVRQALVRVFAFAVTRGWSLEFLESFRTTFMLLLIALLAFVGVWAASRAEKLLGRKDPGAVVVDEVVGQLIAFVFLPFNAGMWAIITGFVAFRLFDIWKPYPIRRLEALDAGLGIMGDDVLAGIYAAILMSLLVSIHLLL
jgi:phosphatidylglycerophosphatase A